MIRRCLHLAMLFCAGWFALAANAGATELKAKTVQAFEHYVSVTEARLAGELGGTQGFLWVDRLPAQGRREALAQLQQGQAVVERMETRENGKAINVPEGMVHHWVAVVFVPGVTLAQTLAQLKDYDHYQDIYKPDLQRSRVLSTNGQDFRVYMRLYRKAIVTAVYNAEFDIGYFPLQEKRAYSRSTTARIAEVENPGQPGEREKPAGKDGGYLWRLNTYGHYEERDGGVYIELETIALSRSVPAILAWLVNPYIRSIPREYLTHMLASTRTALTAKQSAASLRASSSGYPACRECKGGESNSGKSQPEQ